MAQDRVTWITNLSEKKPFVALVAVLLCGIVSLASVVVYKDRALGAVQDEAKKDIAEAKKEFKADLMATAAVLKECQSENKEWSTNYIKRIDLEAEKRDREAQKRITRFETLEAKKTRLRAQGESLLIDNSSKIKSLTKPSDESN